MLAIARDPEHQDLTCTRTPVAQSVAGPPVAGGLSRNTRDVSAVCTIKEAKWKPILRREAKSKRRQTVQVEGRHPYLVTRAAVLGVGGGVPLTATLHAHKSRDKGV